MTRWREAFGADDRAADQPNGILQATTAAMALVAATNAVVAVWATSQPDADLIAMAETMFDQIDSVWPTHSRNPPS